MGATERRASVPREIRPVSPEGDVLPSHAGRPAVRLTRIRPRAKKKFRLPVLTLGLLASLSGLHLVLFRRAKRRLGF